MSLNTRVGHARHDTTSMMVRFCHRIISKETQLSRPGQIAKCKQNQSAPITAVQNQCNAHGCAETARFVQPH